MDVTFRLGDGTLADIVPTGDLYVRTMDRSMPRRKELPMLKITRLGKVGNVVIQVEGTLVGPWVKQLEGCWRSVAAKQVCPVRVNLSAVSFIDEAGQNLLRTMYEEHVELLR